MHLHPGTLIQGGKYRIIRFIKSGGFGCTYEAVHTVFDERVAIKEFFPKDFCNRDEDTLHITVGTQSKTALVAKLKRKFIEEAVALRKLPHSGIVKVADVFEENGTAYYVMDYIDGCSLDDIVKREGALAEAKALSYIRQICAALDYVHSQNRLHLDIKPGNVMVDAQGRTVLIDFGTSKQYDEENGENTSTIMGMTPGYAPLEQYNRSGLTHFSIPTDIYAIGATLYKLLVGHTPPEASLLIKPSALVLPPDMSGNMSSAIRKALLPCPDDRPQSVAEFMAMLDAGKSEVTLSPSLKHDTSVVEDGATEVLVEPEEASEPFCQVYYNDGVLYVDNVKYPMVRVEGGTFTMGDGGIFSDNRRHEVTLDSYSIGQYEVTQDIWETLMGGNPSYIKGARRPVEWVSWDDCQDFIRKLNALTGQNFRLPTEAEWEFAARGGNSSRGYKYSGSNVIDDIAWYRDNSGRQAHDVGTKSPNELGIYDMVGNVNEWCSDWYQRYNSSSQINPDGPSSGFYRVIRGGSWSHIARYCRVSDRSGCTPGQRLKDIGFRLCL